MIELNPNVAAALVLVFGSLGVAGIGWLIKAVAAQGRRLSEVEKGLARVQGALGIVHEKNGGRS